MWLSLPELAHHRISEDPGTTILDAWYQGVIDRSMLCGQACRLIVVNRQACPDDQGWLREVS